MSDAASMDPGKSRGELACVLDRLGKFMEPGRARQWLEQPNAAFDGSTPLQVVERGEMDRIWRMLYDLESGQPS
jgi:hypothetical protein